MKVVLASPITPISSRQASHRGAQGVIYASMLKELGHDVTINFHGAIGDLNNFDAVYAYHGNDWFGGLNIFGGVQGFGSAANVRDFGNFQGPVYSLAIEFPKYYEMFQDRIKKAKEKGTPVLQEFLSTNWDNFKKFHETAPIVKYPIIHDKVVIGDSHAISMYRPGWSVNSVPFKTLHGALKSGLASFIEDVRPISEVNSVECYFGNIDIRHHVCRLPGDFRENTRQLALKYLKAVEALPIKDVSIYELLPIEDESRKLPQTGYYEKKPFWGSWDQRNEARLIFRQILEENTTRAKIIRWTDYLLNSKGQLSFDHMEKPRSVHLSRGSYLHWTGEEFQPKVEAAGLEAFFA